MPILPLCRRASLVVAAGLGATALAIAQPQAAPEPMRAVPLAAGEHIPVNGRLDHPAWGRAPVYERFVTKDPVPGLAPTRATRVRLLHDAHALYVGIDALDPHPQAIRAPLVRHDGVNRTQDFVVVYLDAVGSRQAAQFFRVNAAGSTADGMHTHADDHEDFAPDFDFDAAAARHAGGWSAVLRIPFASLRYPADATQPWRIMVGRRVPREQFMLDTSVPVLRELPSFIANMQVLEGVRPPGDHGFLTLRPSLTLRSERRREGGVSTRGAHAQASLDIKWRPRAELVADLTLNPDFSQVALDVPQLRGNTQFALELAEKRPFFFESSDLLRSPGGGVYTRSFTEPRLGARATWRGERAAATAFAIDDRGGGLTLLPGAFATGVAVQPPSRTLLGRVRGDAGALQWGALAVQRDYRDVGGADLGHNRVAGPDLAWQIDEVWRMKAQWLGSSTTAWDDAQGRLVAAPARQGQRLVMAATRQVDNAQTDLTLDQLDADFRHDSGFVVQNGVRGIELKQGLGWFEVKPLNELWFNLRAYEARRRGSGMLVQQTLTPSFWMGGPHNLALDLQWHGHSLLRSHAAGPLLRERYLRAELSVTPATWMPLLRADLSLGRLADVGALDDPADDTVRRGGRFSLTPTMRPLPRLELEPQVSQAWLRGEGGRRAYAESASQLLAVWHFDAQRTLRGIAQRTSLARDGQRLWAERSLSLTFAWRASAGSVLYVGATRASQDTLAARGSEVFVKLQLDADDLRQDRIRW